MKPKSRFIASVLKTAKTDMPALPYARGAARAGLSAKQRTAEPARKSA